VSRETETKTSPFGVGALRELRTRFYLISSQEKTLAAFLFYLPPAILRHPVLPPLDDSATHSLSRFVNFISFYLELLKYFVSIQKIDKNKIILYQFKS